MCRGYVNVLPEEAEMPYDQVRKMDGIDGQFAQVDVILLGANEVVDRGP